MKRIFKRKILNIIFIFNQFGFDPIRLYRSIKYSPNFLIDFISFNKNNNSPIYIKPCLHDKFDEGGSAKSEYFWQDLLVGSLIFSKNPFKHVDIGSRIDGFVAHLACFREVEVFDVRNISSKIPKVKFVQANMMDTIPLKLQDNENGYCDSLSCLHTIEHFGLGRYGDPIDNYGYDKGIKNMSSLLKKDGIFYLSTPIGIERVEFNANRVFNPYDIIKTAEKYNLKLNNIIIIEEDGEHKHIDLDLLKFYSEEYYNLALFIFHKL
jgi:hypothetical protein